MSISIQKPLEPWCPGARRHLPLPAENSLWGRISHEPPAGASDAWPKCFSLETLCLQGSGKTGPNRASILEVQTQKAPPATTGQTHSHICIHVNIHASTHMCAHTCAHTHADVGNKRPCLYGYLQVQMRSPSGPEELKCWIKSSHPLMLWWMS